MGKSCYIFQDCYNIFKALFKRSIACEHAKWSWHAEWSTGWKLLQKTNCNKVPEKLLESLTSICFKIISSSIIMNEMEWYEYTISDELMVPLWSAVRECSILKFRRSR